MIQPSSQAKVGPVIQVSSPRAARRPVATPRKPRKPLPITGLHIHFVGIGGSGMSGLARLAKERGAIITGSDQADGPTIEMLTDAGINVSLEQTADSVPADVEMVAISAAIKNDHPEVIEAKRRGLRVIKYSKMLGELMIGRVGIAVSGTHGKSSTTSMASHVMIQCGLDPSVIVGATCKQVGGGFRCGEGETLVAEACEYDRSFHNLHPTLAVILNVEEDHLDYYSGITEIVESFTVFARRLPTKDDGGFLLINHEMSHRLAITAGLECDVQTLGFIPQADWQVEVAACGLAAEDESASSASLVRLHHEGKIVAQWRSPLPGDHMCYNAAAAAVLAQRAGASWEGIAAALESFGGLDRRMQFIGTRTPLPLREGSQITIIDDYGHHPTEVETTLRALRRHYKPTRLICVFQPHQHSRTRFLLEQFATSFAEADLVIVPHIYFVRDTKKEQHAVKAGDLVDRLRQRGKAAMHLYPFEAIVEQLNLIAQPGDLVVTMGAGDVWRIAKSFLRQ
ncbi:MAG: UDP-N-acetylmuramate--L-alanine ligase [Phycisphaeraceae bacterium]